VVKPNENLIANTTLNFGYYTVLLPNKGGVYTSILGTKTHAVSKKKTVTKPIKKKIQVLKKK
jgi:hypothetical protein